MVLTLLAAGGCDPSTGVSREGEHLLQTDRPTYDLLSDGRWLRAEIPYTFTNRTGAPVYLANCRGGFALRLEREEGDGWVTAWSPILLMCLSPPIVIDDGVEFVDTLVVSGALPGENAAPAFDVEDPSGTYRIVWEAALSSYDKDDYPFGSQLPLEDRTSNRLDRKSVV